MRKHQTLLVAGILLLASAGVAQAQDAAVYQVVGSAVTAREGGAAEATGSVVLSRIAGAAGNNGNRNCAVFRSGLGGANHPRSI